MSMEIAVLAAPHPTDCRVCGGSGRVRVAELRSRGGSEGPAWVLAKVLPCPLSSSADGLRALLGSAPVGPEGGA